MTLSSICRMLAMVALIAVVTVPVAAQQCDVTVDALELDNCCFDLFISNDAVGLTVGGIGVNVLSRNDTIVSSDQPTNWTVSRSARSLTWGIGGGLGSGDFEFAGLCLWTDDGSARVEFVFRTVGGGVACRDTLDLVCAPTVAECVDFAPQSIECVTLPTGGPGQELTFSVTNLDSCARTKLSFSVPSPAGITVTPTITLSPPLAINDSAVGLKLSFGGTGLQGVTSLMLVVTSEGVRCACTDTFTVFLANCTPRCFDLTTVSLLCDSTGPMAPGFDWTILLANQQDCSISSLQARVTSPSTGVTITPSDINVAPELPKGGQRGFDFRIDGATPGSDVTIMLSPSGIGCGCDSLIVLRLPDCRSGGGDGCVLLTSRDVVCDPVGEVDDYVYTFDIENTSSDTVYALAFTTPTPNVVFDPTPIVMSTPVAPGGTLAGQSIRIHQGGPGSMDVVMTAIGSTGPLCGDTVSLFLPNCVTAVPGESSAGIAMAVRPNPAQDRVNVAIHVSRPIRSGELAVVDARGSVVLRLPLRIGLEAGNHEFTLDVSRLPVGSYLVELAGDGSALHRSLQITR